MIVAEAYFAFLYNTRQINDIKKFCCQDSNPSVLPIDTTYNLCDLWVTDSSYRNKRLINRASGNYPVFIGPMMLHFTKDENAFGRFALELLSADHELVGLKNIGVDMEKAIYRGFKNIIPSVSRLLCVRHLKQRDEKKVDKLLARVHHSASDNQHAKFTILHDIYGNRTGGYYEFGLAEAINKDDFDIKLLSLQEKWDALCPGFFSWFQKRRSSLFVESVIQSARDNTDVQGLYYQNDVESMHYVEKLNQQFEKKPVFNVNFFEFVQ